MMIAFYKASGKWDDYLIRWYTNSKYSHVEIIINGLAYSSSPRDGGVRRKEINFDKNNWDIYDVSIDSVTENDVLKFYEETKDVKYGWLDLFFWQFLFLRLIDFTGQTCSEWIADSLKFTRPASFSPETLYQYMLANKLIKRN